MKARRAGVDLVPRLFTPHSSLVDRVTFSRLPRRFGLGPGNLLRPAIAALQAARAALSTHLQVRFLPFPYQLQNGHRSFAPVGPAACQGTQQTP